MRATTYLVAAVALLTTLGCSSDDTDSNDRGDDDRAHLKLSLLRAVPDMQHGGRFVDADGRHVILRGVNVNAFVEYWAGTPFPITFPFTEEDAAAMEAIGWNVVRLLASWSRVEPAPGVYDEDYLDQLEEAVGMLADHGIYSIVDLHQDAWGATLGAAADEVCSGITEPAIGWDGAPAWATQHGDRPRCAPPGTRDLSPAVVASFRAFWSNAEGPGSVGIRTRYATMFGHVARRFAGVTAVAGFDLMNEPSAFRPQDEQGLAAMHAECHAAIRASESSAGTEPHVVFFEPSGLWATFFNRPFDFPRDDNVAYSPHLYQGGIFDGPLEDQFAVATADAASFGGVPVLTGEWGSGPDRARDPDDSYFRSHQDLQDDHLMSATLWTWRESCGDAHKAEAFRDGEIASVWGEFEVDCRDNSITGRREELIGQLTRTYVRAAPGRIESMSYDSLSGNFTASGIDAVESQQLVVFHAESQHGPPVITNSGLRNVQRHQAPGGNAIYTASATGGAWSIGFGTSP